MLYQEKMLRVRVSSLRCLLTREGGFTSPKRAYQWRKASNWCHCLLFPGQGSQYVGMGQNLIAAADSGALPGAARLFAAAERVLGYDLRPLFLQGPQERLDETVHCQPAVVVSALAGLEHLRHHNPEVLAARHWQ